MHKTNSKIQSLAAIIPMYNEVENVRPFITEVQQALAFLPDFAIVVVDDGSNDGTVTELQNLQRDIPQLIVVKHQHNYGQSAAIVSGAQATQHAWLVTLDGDGQNNPHDIAHLIKAYDALEPAPENVLIAGNRAKRRDAWLRRISSRIANNIRKWMLSDDCPDTGCSLKLFPRALFLRLPHFNHLHRFIPALCKRAGATVINVPVSHRPRTRGTSKYGVMNRLWVGIVDLFGVAWLIARPCRPELTEHAE